MRSRAFDVRRGAASEDGSSVLLHDSQGRAGATRDEAKAKATAHLREFEAQAGALAIIDAETRRSGNGWLFFYNSAAYLTSGNVIDALAGNGPLLVGDDGRLRVLGTAIPWQEQVETGPGQSS